MKNPLTALLPAMALLALGGCASTAGLASSEDDGVYYSAKDRTTAVVAAAPTPASTDEAANPDYHGSTGKSHANQGSGSSQYYDNTYTYMKGVPTSPGLSYYSPYSPYTTLSYAGGYGWGGGACGFSPYAYGGGFYDPFYSSFYSPYYSPFGYGYRSGISVNFGFGYGRSYGYGGYSPFGYGYSPYGYGYGGYGGFYDPFYSPYYYGGPFYGGYYGRGGYYGNSYYGGSSYGYGNSSSYDNRSNGRTSGHRSDRSSEVGAWSAGANGGATSAPTPAGGGRMRSEMVAQPGTATPADGVLPDRSRGRADASAATPNTAAEQSSSGFNRPQRLERSEQPQYRDMDQSTRISRQQEVVPAQGQTTRDDSRGRWRNNELNSQAGQAQPSATPQPVETERRRGGFFRSMAGDQPANNGGQMAEQPQRRSYEQPRQERTYEQPQQRSYEQPQQRSYEQPRQERTFSQPSQPSYSAPSYGGGGGGGGGRRGRD